MVFCVLFCGDFRLVGTSEFFPELIAFLALSAAPSLWEPGSSLTLSASRSAFLSRVFSWTRANLCSVAVLELAAAMFFVSFLFVSHCVFLFSEFAGFVGLVFLAGAFAGFDAALVAGFTDFSTALVFLSAGFPGLLVPFPGFFAAFFAGSVLVFNAFAAFAGFVGVVLVSDAFGVFAAFAFGTFAGFTGFAADGAIVLPREEEEEEEPAPGPPIIGIGGPDGFVCVSAGGRPS